jgi:hypothetical protein
VIGRNECRIGPLTLCQHFPFAGLAPRRIRQDIIEFIEQRLHLAPSLSLGHFMADTELWSTTVVPAARSTRVFRTLQICYIPMLHGVMVSGRNI